MVTFLSMREPTSYWDWLSNHPEFNRKWLIPVFLIRNCRLNSVCFVLWLRMQFVCPHHPLNNIQQTNWRRQKVMEEGKGVTYSLYLQIMIKQTHWRKLWYSIFYWLYKEDFQPESIISYLDNIHTTSHLVTLNHAEERSCLSLNNTKINKPDSNHSLLSEIINGKKSNN